MSEKKVGKRLLTWVLVLIMALSMLPLNVLADETAPSDVKIGHYDEGGSWAEGTPNQNLPDGVDSVSKTAEPTGNSNEYTVKLEVKMHTTTETQTSYAKAATVLVIDTSGSMGYCVEHGKKDHCNNSRLGAAKAAAIDFLDSYRAGGTGRYVALVDFNTTATVADADWQDVSSDAGYNTILTAIKNLKVGGGTNLDDGLQKANQLFTETDVQGIGSKNIIALTDGKPTYYMTTFLGFLPTLGGDGEHCSKDVFEATANTAESIRTSGTTLYSICFGAANEEVKNPYTNNKISLFEYLNEYIAPARPTLPIISPS